jgi:hypothetical protein
VTPSFLKQNAHIKFEIKFLPIPLKVPCGSCSSGSLASYTSCICPTNFQVYEKGDIHEF